MRLSRTPIDYERNRGKILIHNGKTIPGFSPCILARTYMGVDGPSGREF
jgi:hypothetical protein